MLSPYWVDLHIHTVLSPCGHLEMGAPEIVRQAREAGIDVIGVSDHNSCINFLAVSEAAAGNPVVLPCMEIQSAEDIHILCIFPSYEIALACKEWLWKKIRDIPNDEEYFGYQLIIDTENNIVGEEGTLLIQGADYEIDQIVAHVHELGGLAILAHVDRQGFSYTTSLGPPPVDYPADAFELTWRLSSAQAEEWRSRYPDRTFIRSSDSHQLAAMSRSHCTKMTLAEPTFREIKKALKGEDDRRISWPWG